MDTRQTFEPRSYQMRAIDHVLHYPRCALWVGMGMGKTVSVLTAIDIMYVIGMLTGSVLVVAPLRVAKSVWPAEIEKWDHLSSLTVQPIFGDPGARLRRLSRRSDIYTINFENLPWLLEHYRTRDWPFQMIVVDESTRLKGFRLRQGTKRAKALASMSKRVDRFVELTGTPAPNGLIDLWGQAWFLDGGERLGATFSAFKTRWFYPEQAASQFARWVPFRHAADEIQARLKDLCLTLRAEDFFDLKQPIFTKIEVELPEHAKTHYRELEKILFTEIADDTVTADNAAAKTMKCLQLCNGAIYRKEGDWIEVHKAKIEALQSIVEEAAGASVLVAYHFKSDLARLLKAFPDARHLDSDPATEAAWCNGEIPILLAHPKSAGHGLNLQYGGNILAFFGHWWDLEARLQIIERIGPTRQMQAGFDRSVMIYDIVAKGTIDETVVRRHATKNNVHELLLNAMKRKDAT